MWRRCLGDLPFKADGKEVVDCTPEMRRIELQPGDSAVVLATDGLWDVMSDTDVVSIVTKARAARFSSQPILRLEQASIISKAVGPVFTAPPLGSM